MRTFALTVLAVVAAMINAPHTVAGDQEMRGSRWRNTNVTRVLDLTSHVARVNVSIDFELEESAVLSNTNLYTIIISQIKAQKLAYFAAFWVEAEGATPSLLDHELREDRSSSQLLVHDVALPGSVMKGSLLVTLAYAHSMEPLPTQIAQYERQKVVFTLPSRHIASPYHTVYQITRAFLASHHVENIDKLQPVSQLGNELTFGPYLSVEAINATSEWPAPLQIHFENHAPATTFASVIREIFLPCQHPFSLFRWAHWLHWLGVMSSCDNNIEVRTSSTLKHAGARLNGGFSRLEYQQELQRRAVQASYTSGASAAIQSVREHLLDGVHSVSYSDAMGNVSSSAIVTEETRAFGDLNSNIVNKSVLQINLRYPLFGGWQASFGTRYLAPHSGPVAHDERLSMEIPFGMPVEQAATDHLELRVVLPEGASAVRLVPESLPFKLKSASLEMQAVERGSLLAALGIVTFSTQPVLVLTKENVVWEHYQNFSVEYKLDSYDFMVLADWLCSAALLPIIVGILLWWLSF